MPRYDVLVIARQAIQELTVAEYFELKDVALPQYFDVRENDFEYNPENTDLELNLRFDADDLWDAHEYVDGYLIETLSNYGLSNLDICKPIELG